MKFSTKTARLVVAAGLVLGVVAAQAASGFTVDKKQEMMAQIGMTSAEVQQALGRPARIEKFRNQDGPTWVYEVAGGTRDKAVFDIDFGSDGRVKSVNERIVPVE